MKTTKSETGQILQKGKNSTGNCEKLSTMKHKQTYRRASHSKCMCAHVHTHAQRPHSPEENYTARGKHKTAYRRLSRQQTAQMSQTEQLLWEPKYAGRQQSKIFSAKRKNMYIDLQVCSQWTAKTKVAYANRKHAKGDLQAERKWQLEI